MMFPSRGSLAKCLSNSTMNIRTSKPSCRFTSKNKSQMLRHPSHTEGPVDEIPVVNTPRRRYRARIAFKTALGRSVIGKAEYVLQRPKYKKYLEQKVDLIFTSPPFPLNTKKKYGNEQGERYVDWLTSFAPLFKTVLKPKGSIVLELGNAWESGRPVMSTLALKALLAFLERGGFVLCQQFVWNNPARLPSPAQWVTVERIRVKDSYTHLWWMALTDRPHADNRQVLKTYSKSMKALLEAPKLQHWQEALRTPHRKDIVPNETRRGHSIEPDRALEHASKFQLSQLLPCARSSAASCQDAYGPRRILHQIPDKARHAGFGPVRGEQHDGRGSGGSRPAVVCDRTNGTLRRRLPRAVSSVEMTVVFDE